jgi:AcrR family transcriptional regulator
MTVRMSADERREQVLKIAVEEFGRRGLEGTSTETIAKRVGVAQPYLFRLFGTKKQLFIEAVERCCATITEVMEKGAGDLTGEEALDAMGMAYLQLMLSEPDQHLMQMQQFAACHDPEVRAAVRKGIGRVWAMVERVSGAPVDARVLFMARGMLCNVLTAMGVNDDKKVGNIQEQGDVSETWGTVLDGLVG